MSAALFLCDKTTVMAKPWADAGYLCYCVDIQHPAGETRDGNIIRVGADVTPDALSVAAPQQDTQR